MIENYAKPHQRNNVNSELPGPHVIRFLLDYSAAYQVEKGEGRTISYFKN